MAIVLLAVPMIAISLAIIIDDPGPVVFKQKRVGIKKYGKLTYFSLYKFRSMKVAAPRDIPTHLLENPRQHFTRVGRILRQTSADELPQLFNILLSKMSLIGPRPALWNQYDLIREREKYGANDIKPGLTGWAQVNGRDTIGIEAKARYDGEYANSITPFMDWVCFWKTLSNVISCKDVDEGRKSRVIEG